MRGNLFQNTWTMTPKENITESINTSSKEKRVKQRRGTEDTSSGVPERSEP